MEIYIGHTYSDDKSNAAAAEMLERLALWVAWEHRVLRPTVNQRARQLRAEVRDVEQVAEFELAPV